MFSLANKKAVITGAGSGIGKAMAILFAAQGAELHLLDLDEKAVGQTADEIKKEKVKAFTYSCNVADQKAVVDVFTKIGELNILVNNAGIANIGKAGATKEAEFDHVIEVNVKGVYNCIFAAIPG